MRKPFQGVWNIIRFNWQYFVLSIITIVALLLVNSYFFGTLHTIVTICLWIIVFANFTSLVVSFFIYDLSSLYKFTWLNGVKMGSKMINVNAGFDETSNLLANKFPNANLTVFDFYDPVKHTEVSIERARKAYPPYPNTQLTSTIHLPLQDKSIDNIFAILSTHEIRNHNERIGFFKELNRVLVKNGQVIVTEHLRDTANFIAYNIGFFHFHSKTTWIKTFKSAGFSVANEIKITPFITTFILEKNGIAS